MYDLDNMPAKTLLNKAENYTGPGHLSYLALFVNKLGYRKFTRKDPGGREVTKHDIRHLLRSFSQGHAAKPNRREEDRAQ
jgi:hypothetical protein